MIGKGTVAAQTSITVARVISLWRSTGESRVDGVVGKIARVGITRGRETKRGRGRKGSSRRGSITNGVVANPGRKARIGRRTWGTKGRDIGADNASGRIAIIGRGTGRSVVQSGDVDARHTCSCTTHIAIPTQVIGIGLTRTSIIERISTIKGDIGGGTNGGSITNGRRKLTDIGIVARDTDACRTGIIHNTKIAIKARRTIHLWDNGIRSIVGIACSDHRAGIIRDEGRRGKVGIFTRISSQTDASRFTKTFKWFITCASIGNPITRGRIQHTDNGRLQLIAIAIRGKSSRGKTVGGSIDVPAQNRSVEGGRGTVRQCYRSIIEGSRGSVKRVIAPDCRRRDRQRDGDIRISTNKGRIIKGVDRRRLSQRQWSGT